jgi:hypothetical protein
MSDNSSPNVNSNALSDPNMSQRNPSKPYNQLHPRSLRSEGLELDEACGADVSQAEAGRGLDRAIRVIDGKEK